MNKRRLHTLLATFFVLAFTSATSIGGTTVISDTFDGASDTTGFNLDNGVNFGINPPTTRLTGTAATNLYYFQTVATKPASVYDISENAIRIQTNSSVGRFTFTADGVTPFDFAPYLGTATASPTNPVIYDIRISMRNDSTTAARFSFGLSTAEGDINAMDCAVQVYRNAAANSYYTLAERVDSESSGVADFGLTTLTAQAPANTVTTFLPILIRITDAGEQSGTNYSSRAQISIDNGTTWIFDTDVNTTQLPNGWRLDGPGRYFLFDIAGNASASVYYDEFSVTLQPTWNGGGADNNWSTAANWSGGTPSGVDALYFAGTNRLAPVMEEDYSASLLTFLASAGSFNISAAPGKTLTLNGDLFQNAATAQTLNAPIFIGAARTITTPNGALTLGGDISGPGGLTKAQTGNLTLGGTNTYSGKTSINRGNLFISSVTNVGAGASSLGAPTDVAEGTINLGNGGNASSLRYTGTGHATDRVINLSSGSGAPSIYANGSGPLILTSDFTATGGNSKTLNLRGTSTADNTVGGAIVNNSGTVSLTKNDAGKWILGGVNTYAGPTTITAGKLEVNGSIAVSSAVAIAAAGTLGGTGTVPGTVGVTGTLSAGTSVGKLTTGALTLNSSGTNLFEISGAIGAAGVNWDLVDAGVNSVDVQATSATPFRMKLSALGLNDFNKDTTYSWLAIAGLVQNFSADKFTVIDSGFTNDIAGGIFSVESPGDGLRIKFVNNQSPTAQPTNFTFAAGPPFLISIADLLANRTSDPDGDARVLVSVTSTNASVSTNATDITINSASSLTESIAYVVKDARNYKAGDTVRTATNYINIVVTNAPNGGTFTISNNGGSASLTFYGNAGQSYIIQRSQNLTAWTDIATNTAAGDGTIQFSEVPPVNPAFYRSRTSQ